MTQIHLNGITLPLSMEFTPIRMERWIRNIGRYYRLTDTSVCPFLENNASHKVYLYVLTLDHKSVNDPLTNQPSLTGGSGNHEPFQSSGAHTSSPLLLPRGSCPTAPPARPRASSWGAPASARPHALHQPLSWPRSARAPRRASSPTPLSSSSSSRAPHPSPPAGWASVVCSARRPAPRRPASSSSPGPGKVSVSWRLLDGLCTSFILLCERHLDIQINHPFFILT